MGPSNDLSRTYVGREAKGRLAQLSGRSVKQVDYWLWGVPLGPEWSGGWVILRGFANQATLRPQTI